MSGHGEATTARPLHILRGFAAAPKYVHMVKRAGGGDTNGAPFSFRRLALFGIQPRGAPHFHYHATHQYPIHQDLQGRKRAGRRD